MGVLGVISCQTLELEFAYLMVNDPDVASVTVMKDLTLTVSWKDLNGMAA